jgi:flagellar L-ring protein precursor FlgH
MKPIIVSFLIATQSFGGIFSAVKKKPPPPTALDEYVRAAESRSLDENAGRTAGSTWTNSTSMGDLARDVLASHVDDVVTIIVSEQASAVSAGATKTSRVSSAKNSINALAGATAPTGQLANLANLSGDTELNGAGSTSRTTNLTTSLTTRVAQVLPNGYLVVEGTKNIQINSDWQTIKVRGVVRPADLAPNNTVPSSSVADLDIQLDGKGVVNDAIRRPMFLYRLLLGLLPF